MGYRFLNDLKYNSDYFLKQAIVARHNSIVLKESAKSILEHQPKRRYGLLYWFTAFEELQKAVFHMLVHRDFMNKEQIFPVLSKHEAKIILFEKIFRSSKGLSIHDNVFILDGIPLKEINFEQLLKENQDYARNYMNKRNDCLYSRPDVSGYYSPAIRSDLEVEISKLIYEMTALNALYELLWKYDFKGNVDGFQYYKLTPKDKPDKYHVTFAGGEIIERKDFRPSWVDNLQKELEHD